MNQSQEDKKLQSEMDKDLAALKSLVINMHALLCKRDHTTHCQFYREEMDIKDPWVHESHKDWMQITKTFLRLNQVDTKTMTGLLNYVVEISVKINQLLTKHPKMAKLLSEIFNDMFNNFEQSQH